MRTIPDTAPVNCARRGVERMTRRTGDMPDEEQRKFDRLAYID